MPRLKKVLLQVDGEVLLNSATSPGARVARETAGGGDKGFPKLVEARAVNVDASANGCVTKRVYRCFGMRLIDSCGDVGGRIPWTGAVGR
jgi:hypothetical protein